MGSTGGVSQFKSKNFARSFESFALSKIIVVASLSAQRWYLHVTLTTVTVSIAKPAKSETQSLSLAATCVQAA